jgi:UDP-N-acetylmuramate dehydrogenase
VQARLPRRFVTLIGMIDLAELTTLRLGGPARCVIDCADTESLIHVVESCDDAREPLLVLGGGSNVLVADAGFDGTVVRVLSSGVENRGAAGRVIVTAQAGESWDRLVNRCIGDGLAGIECLAGIPGSTGATPIQNVGAYGQEVAQTITRVVAYDRAARETRSLTPAECRFAYRSSIFKQQGGRWVVSEVDFALRERDTSEPIRYSELARYLKVTVGESAPLADVRDAVLHLRRAKGMVLDPDDPDTVSAGSFFLNPILDADQLTGVRARVHDLCGPGVEPPIFPAEGEKVKTSAAWLIERAGFHRGYGDRERIAISSKHMLALTNRGSGTTAELVTLAREIAGTVWQRFGIEIKPEPVFVGHTWTVP